MSTRGKVARGKPAYDDATEIYGRSAHPSGLRPEDSDSTTRRAHESGLAAPQRGFFQQGILRDGAPQSEHDVALSLLQSAEERAARANHGSKDKRLGTSLSKYELLLRALPAMRPFEPLRFEGDLQTSERNERSCSSPSPSSFDVTPRRPAAWSGPTRCPARSLASRPSSKNTSGGRCWRPAAAGCWRASCSRCAWRTARRRIAPSACRCGAITVLRERLKIPPLTARMSGAVVDLVCSDQLSRGLRAW